MYCLQRNGTEKESTNKRKYLDFIDILLEARVSSSGGMKEEIHICNFLYNYRMKKEVV